MAYVKIHEYVMENGLEISGSMIDLYLYYPNIVELDKIITEIQVPVK